MKRVAAVLVLAILLAGCRAEVRILLDIAESGSGTLAAEVGINNELKVLIDRLAGDSETIISELDLGLVGEGSTRLEGDMTIYRTEVAFEPETDIAELAAGNFTSFALEMTDAGTSLEATLDVAGELDLAQFPVAPSSIDPETLDARIIVSLPGDVTNHNADVVTADGKFSWTIPLEEELYMFANTSFPKSGFPWWLVTLLGLSIALAIAVWFAAVRREKKTTEALRKPPQPPPVNTPKSERADSKSPFFDLDG